MKEGHINSSNSRVQMIKKINEGPNFWSNSRLHTNKKNKSMWTLVFGRMVVHKERINERGSYIFVEWSCANDDDDDELFLWYG